MVKNRNTTDLPGADDTVMESVDHVKDVRFAKWHLALLGGVVVEVRPEIGMNDGVMIMNNILIYHCHINIISLKLT